MNTRKIARLALTGVALGLLSACNLHLVSDYDPQMDTGVTDAQVQIEKIFQKLRSCARNAQRICVDPSKTFDSQDYAALQIKLNVIELRSEATKTDLSTTKQVELLKQALLEEPDNISAQSNITDKNLPPIQSLESRHKQNAPMAMEDIKDAQELINTHIRAILTYELGKKSGKSKES